jgi:hypothetical protein
MKNSIKVASNPIEGHGSLSAKRQESWVRLGKGQNRLVERLKSGGRHDQTRNRTPMKSRTGLRKARDRESPVPFRFIQVTDNALHG